MSVAICRSSSTVSFPPPPLERRKEVLLLGSSITLTPTPSAAEKEAVVIENDDGGGGGGESIDIWSSIQAHKLAKRPNAVDEPYVHPLTRLASGGRLLSQKSLEICTESLGSETGSDDYFSFSEDVDMDCSSPPPPPPIKQHEQEEEEGGLGGGDVVDHDEVEEHAGVNYHCSISRRSPSRCFPPPLPSISSRDGPCVQMRPHRKDGRLVVEAVAVPSQNYLHAQRQGGRLLLSFINTTTPKRNNNNNNIINTNPISTPEQAQAQAQELAAEEVELPEEEVVDEEEEMELEEEEEVEVVDRGTVVEVKVSTQPQQQSGGPAAARVHRSSIVINKFVSCTSLSSSRDKEKDDRDVDAGRARTTSPRRTTASATTAAAAAVAASSLGGTLPDDGGSQPGSFDNKPLLFTSRRRNREELLRDMRRCSQLRKPLFIWEPCCIATSS